MRRIYMCAAHVMRHLNLGSASACKVCVSETSEEEEDERVKCVGGDKSSLTLSFWISCFLFIVALKCCTMKITRL